MKFAWRSNASCSRSSMWSKDRRQRSGSRPGAPRGPCAGPEVALVDPGRNAGHPAKGGGHPRAPRARPPASRSRGARRRRRGGRRRGCRRVPGRRAPAALPPPSRRALGPARAVSVSSLKSPASGIDWRLKPRRAGQEPPGGLVGLAPLVRRALLGLALLRLEQPRLVGHGQPPGLGHEQEPGRGAERHALEICARPRAAHGRPGRAPPRREAGPCRRGGPARCARRAAPRFARRRRRTRPPATAPPRPRREA